LLPAGEAHAGILGHHHRLERDRDLLVEGGATELAVGSRPCARPGPRLAGRRGPRRIGMARQSVWTFTPFASYSGPICLAVGDYLRQGYQQLIAGTAGDTPQVAIYDLVQTFVREGADRP
jgi:hypothetical protein